MSQTVVINARATFPKYLEGQQEQFEGKGDHYWSGSFIIPRDGEDAKKVKAAIAEVLKAQFPKNHAAMLKVFASKDKLPLHDGDLKADKPYGAAYAGNYFISARNNADRNPVQPTVYADEKDPKTGKRREVTSPRDPAMVYSGANVQVKLNIFYYKQGGGEGVSASILGVALLDRNGARLAGGVPAAADDFEEVLNSMPDGDASGMFDGDDTEA